MIRKPLLLAVLATPCPEAMCQSPGVMALTGQYQIGTIGVDPAGQCGPGLPSFFTVKGTYVFMPTGTFAQVNSLRTDVCAGTATTTMPTGTGSYRTFKDSSLVLDFDPANPGTNTRRFHLHTDGLVMVHARDEPMPAGDLTIVTRVPGDGMSLASLTEVYHHMRFEHSSSAAGVSVATAIGTIEFDGLGNYSTQLNRRSSDANGNLSTEPSTVRTGTYIIGRSGKIRIDGATTPSGAVAGDSSILFWVETLGATAALNVAVRQAPGAAPAKLTGDWSVGSSELRVGTDTGLPQTVTRMINVLFAGNGDLSGAGTEVQANPTDNSITALQFGGSWLWSPAGNSNLSVDLPSLPLSLDARLGANGNYMLGMSLETDRVGAIIGLRNCPATAFGSATAGTNDEPTLGLYGGYPVLGNNLFGLALTNGRANSLFTLGIATVAAPPPGRPFLGGTLWIDLDSLIYAPSAALDDLGRGIASLPLPADPSFDGIELYAQGAVFDPIAPGGLALTKGLGMRLCN